MTHRGTRPSALSTTTLVAVWVFALLFLVLTSPAAAQGRRLKPSAEIPTLGTDKAGKTDKNAKLLKDADGKVAVSDPEEGDTEATDEGAAQAPVQPSTAEGEGVIKLDGNTPAVAPSQSLDDTKTKKDKWSPFKIGTSLSSSVGQGSFVANPYARNAYVDWNLSVTPSYTFWKGGPKVSASASVYQELTDSDGDTRNHRVLLSDVALRGSQKIWTIPGVDVGVNVSLSASLPTSLASQTQTLLLGLRGGLGLTRSFGPVTISYNGGVRKNFHEYQSPVVNTKGMPDNIFIAREGGNERVDAYLYSLGGNNVSYSFSNGLSVDVDIIAGLSGSISYTVSNGFTYASYPKDDLASMYADAGRGQRDSFETDISLGYDFKFMQVSLGLSNGAGFLASDNHSLRFPFWDFSGAANNLSTVYLSLSTSASIDGSGVSFQ